MELVDRTLKVFHAQVEESFLLTDNFACMRLSTACPSGAALSIYGSLDS